MLEILICTLFFLFVVGVLYVVYRIGYKHGSKKGEMSWIEFSRQYLGRED